MKILLDENIDIHLENYFPGHEVRHVVSSGWQGSRDEELLAKADEARINIFVSANKEMPFGATMLGRKFALVLLDIRPDTFAAQVACSAEIIRLIEKMRIGNVYLVSGLRNSKRITFPQPQIDKQNIIAGKAK